MFVIRSLFTVKYRYRHIGHAVPSPLCRRWGYLLLDCLCGSIRNLTLTILVDYYIIRSFLKNRYRTVPYRTEPNRTVPAYRMIAYRITVPYGTVHYRTGIGTGTLNLIIWKNCYGLETYNAIMSRNFNLGHQFYLAPVEVGTLATHPSPIPFQVHGQSSRVIEGMQSPNNLTRMLPLCSPC